MDKQNGCIFFTEDDDLEKYKIFGIKSALI